MYALAVLVKFTCTGLCAPFPPFDTVTVLAQIASCSPRNDTKNWQPFSNRIFFFGSCFFSFSSSFIFGLSILYQCIGCTRRRHFCQNHCTFCSMSCFPLVNTFSQFISIPAVYQRRHFKSTLLTAESGDNLGSGCCPQSPCPPCPLSPGPAVP